MHANIRLKLPHAVGKVSAQDENGKEVAITCQWDESSSSALLSYDSHALQVKVTGCFSK